jgi:predicted RNA-binding Zn-ribbon protein involved in translation (DUF1610 family)
MFKIGDITGLRPSCSSGKQQYKSMGAAEAGMRARLRSKECRDGESLNAYHCRSCGFYHFGHNKYKGLTNGEGNEAIAGTQAG